MSKPANPSQPSAQESLVGPQEGYVPTEQNFGRAFIDEDTMVEEPRPHRLVHGGFEGTETLFTLYLPPQEQYQGRLLQYLEGGAGGHENLLRANVMAFGSQAAPWQYEYAFEELGAVLVESNQGHPPNAGHTGFHNDVYLFGASAETARFAKWLAEKLYGSPVRYSYVFGCSGGGHRSFQCLMRAPGVWDGAAPEVFGVNPGPFWSVMGNAVSILGDDVASVRDALEPGGSGDPFDGLSYPQREVLRDLLHMGFPRGATTQLANLPVFPFTLYNSLEYNPDYFRDFWTKRGYLGHDHAERLAGRLRQFTTTIREVCPAGDLSSEVFVAMQLATAGATLQTPYGAKIDYDDVKSTFMSKLTIKTGRAAGREMVIASVARSGALIPFGEKCPELFEGVEPGDEVEIDNRDWIAFCHLYQHNVEWAVPGLHSEGQPVPDDFDPFAVDGFPVHAQTGVSKYDLNVVTPWPGKMIYIGALLDICIWPTMITTFDAYVRSVLGDGAADHYRLWWVENSTHGRAEMAVGLTGDPPAYWRTRLVDYEAVGAAAITALRHWVEDAVEPPRDSSFSLTADKDISLPADPIARGGVQPAVRLSVNGESRAEVKVGTEVTFEGFAEVPDGAGTLVEAEMDFEGTDSWPFQAKGVDGSSAKMPIVAAHTFGEPGTYFPVLRVGSHRDGAGHGGEAVRNLARVRVVVTA
jgi:Tannase and feruloyl esterase